jgi:hypothetical protein
MSRNEVSPIGKFIFGSLVQQQESPFGEGPFWSCGFLLSEEDSQPMFKLLESIIAEQRKLNDKYPPDEQLIVPWGPSMKKNAAGVKEVVDGEFVWKFKRKAIVKRKSGAQERNTPPIIYDASGAIVNDSVGNIGRGSTGKVIFSPYAFAAGRNIGVSFQLAGFQIANLETNEAEALTLAPIAGGFIAEDAPVPTTPAPDVLDDF